MLLSKHNPTMLDVARAAGVSTATVSRVLNDNKVSSKVTESTRSKVETVIKSLGYRRNGLARSLVTGTSGLVGVLIPDVTGPLYAQMARGIEDVLEAHGRNFMIVTSDRDTMQEQVSVDLLLSRKVDALVLIGSRLSGSALTSLSGDHLPVVLVQREANDETRGLSTVSLDNVGGVTDAMRYLFDFGHRSIAHISGVRRDGKERLASYLAFCDMHGLTPLVLPGDSSEQAGVKAAQDLARFSDVTAVLCSNDRVALGLYHGCKTRGVKLPADLSVVGFDDLPWCSYVDPPLTTVRQNGRDMGREAAMAALADLSGAEPELTVVATEFIVRQSVADLRLPRKEASEHQNDQSSPAVCNAIL